MVRMYVGFCFVLAFSTLFVVVPVSADDQPVQTIPAEQGVLSKLERTKIIMSEREQAAASASEGQHSTGSVAGGEGVEGAGKMFRGLFLCLGVLLIITHIIKKFSKKNATTISDKRIVILDRQSLTSKSALVLADVEGRKILIACGSDNINIQQLENEPSGKGAATNFENSLDIVCDKELKLSA